MTTIRMMNENDIETVAGFEREISVISFGNEAICDMEFHVKKINAAYKKEKDGMFVMGHEGGIAGWLWICAKTNSLTCDSYALIKSIYIIPACRRNGYAAELLKSAYEYCHKRSIVKIVTKVYYKNLAARKLFENAMFENAYLTMEYTVGIAKPGSF